MKCPECKKNTLEIKFTKKYIKFKCPCGNKHSITKEYFNMVRLLSIGTFSLYWYWKENPEVFEKAFNEVKKMESS